MNETKVVIHDANILIDLANGGVLGAWFRLGITTIVTDFVLDELRDGEQWNQIEPLVDSGLITVETIAHEDAAKVYSELSMLSQQMGVSIPDASTYRYVKHHGIPILTGDGKLRAHASEAGLDVRGVLWVLDELIRRSVTTEKEAAGALIAIRRAGAWLPVAECKKRLETWQ